MKYLVNRFVFIMLGKFTPKEYRKYREREMRLREKQNLITCFYFPWFNWKQNSGGGFGINFISTKDRKDWTRITDQIKYFLHWFLVARCEIHYRYSVYKSDKINSLR